MAESEKPGVYVIGIIWCTSVYVSKTTGKQYYSVDIAVKGMKNMLSLKLPDSFPMHTLQEGAVVKIPFMIVPSNFKPGQVDFKVPDDFKLGA